MRLLTYIKSKFFIKPMVLYWTVGLLVVSDIFFSDYIPNNNRQIFKIILTFIYIVIFLWTTFYLLFKTIGKGEAESKIKELEEEKEKSPSRFDIFEKDILLLYYKNLLEKFSKNILYIHFLKKKEELTNKANIANYFIILLLFFIVQFTFDYLKPVGPIIFISLASVCIMFCLIIIVWEILITKNIISPIILGHAISIYLLFAWGKNSYIRSYGDEIIGSYFEKNEYRTRYYINIAPIELRNITESPKKYLHLQADIYVYSETEEGETSDGYFTTGNTITYTSKTIIVEKVYSSNGGVLTFTDCQVEIGKKTICNDRTGGMWEIELTKEKVK